MLLNKSGPRAVFLPILALSALLLLGACQQTALVQIESAALGAPANATLEEIALAIAKAGEEEDWIITEIEPGRMRGEIRIQYGKHSAVVLIEYDRSTFSILYDSSHNLNYRDFPEVTYIHPSYNYAVDSLRQAIQKAAAEI